MPTKKNTYECENRKFATFEKATAFAVGMALESAEAEQVRRAVALLQDARQQALAEPEGGGLIERSNLTNRASSIKSEVPVHRASTQEIGDRDVK